MGLLSWIILGLLAGSLARWIMPGRQRAGCLITILLGIAGAFVGGWIGTRVGLGTVDGVNLGSLVTASGGALVVLAIYQALR